MVMRKRRSMKDLAISFLARSAMLPDSPLKNASHVTSIVLLCLVAYGKHSYQLAHFCAVITIDCHIKQPRAFVIAEQKGLSRMVYDDKFFAGDLNVS